MGRFALVWLLGAGLTGTPPETRSPVRFQYDRTEMAVPIKLVFYDLDRDTANRAAESVFQRLKKLNGILSDYDPESELRRLCDTSGEGRAVPVSDDLWRVLVHAQALAQRSDGAFDVSVGPIVRVWRLARQFKKMPPQDLLDRMRQLVGYKAIRLVPEKRALELTKRGMRLDLGGIAKGFALDEALLVLRKHGITRAMIHAGGDIALGDPPPGKTGWTIGVAPREPNGPPAFYISVSRCGVATSGDMWQYVEFGGKRYSHIVDPKTGLGLTDRATVTVVAPDGITADGLSTAVSVLGPAKGMKLVDETPGASVYIVRAPQGKLETHQSSRWKDVPRSAPESGR
jgi:thiamine biosynthesis lipoprotein